MDYAFFFTVAASILGQLSDVYTTGVARSKGWKEVNPVVAWALQKIGFDGVAVIKGLVIGFLSPTVFYAFLNRPVGLGIAAVSAVVGFYAGIKNYRALTAAKIKVF